MAAGRMCGTSKVASKAASNKIVFTGVGYCADPNVRNTPRSVLFCVDIEDRSEPDGIIPVRSVRERNFPLRGKSFSNESGSAVFVKR